MEAFNFMYPNKTSLCAWSMEMLLTSELSGITHIFGPGHAFKQNKSPFLTQC